MQSPGFIIVLSICFTGVFSGNTKTPRSLEDMQNIAKSGITLDVSGSWWKRGITLKYNTNSRFEISESELLNGALEFAQITIVTSVMVSAIPLQVTDFQISKNIPRMITFNLYHKEEYDLTYQNIQEIQAAEAWLFVEVTNWQRTFTSTQALPLQVVDLYNGKFGFRLERTPFFRGVSSKKDHMTAEIQLTNLRIDESSAKDKKPPTKLSFQNMVYFYLKPKKSTDIVSSDRKIKLDALWDNDDGLEDIPGSCVRVYTDNNSFQEYIQAVLDSNTDVKLDDFRLNRSESNEMRLAKDDTEWIFFTID